MFSGARERVHQEQMSENNMVISDSKLGEIVTKSFFAQSELKSIASIELLSSIRHFGHEKL